MDWIFDHFTLVVFIVVSLASFLKSALDARKRQRDAEPDTPPAPPTEDWFGPAEDWQPPSTPTRQQPTATLPTVKVIFPSPPPSTSPALGPASLQDIQPILSQAQEKRTVTSGGAAATQQRVASSARHPGQPATPSFKRSLRLPKDLRRAIISKEILDSPLALRR